MLIIAMVPVLIVAWLGYKNYNDLLQKSEQQQLEWQLDGKVKSIEHMVESLKGVVQFAARRDRYTELISGNSLEELFLRIQRQYPFFADLGVIDHAGVQQAYIGPYDLHGADYSQEEWFKEVHDRGVYISEVYTGYRQVPHFAVAVGGIDPVTRKFWVLRATIDAATLQQFITTIKTNASDDLFLINDDGILQTASQFYGKTLSLFNSEIKLGIHQKVLDTGESISQAIAKIENTPWSLVLIKKRYIHLKEWKYFRNGMFLTIFACMIISVLVVYYLVNLLTGLIRKAEELQLACLKEAEHRDKLASIGRLAAGVGHEINNPLAIINQKVGLVEDLLELTSDFEHKDTVKKSLEVVNHSVDRCKAITHRLLGFARRTDVMDESLDLNSVIKEVIEFLDNSIVYSRIKLDLQLGDNLPPVVSDRVQLQQIFLNILNNAIDAIGKDGVISIITHIIAGDVRVVIQDNGPGIEEDVLPHIFEPFYTTKETGKGTGLGLSITYGLIKKLGGDITVRSHIGQGTAFTITIPLKSQHHDK
jgi:two-component system NtrC family sensor kinase